MKKRITLFLMGVMMIMSMAGCKKTTYNLGFEGAGFESAKTKYEAGETVKVNYRYLATDTDYNFYLDCEDVEMKRDYDMQNGFTFTFVMPDHDVKICVKSKNSMEMDPNINYSNQPSVENPTEVPDGAWKCPECNYEANTGKFCSNCGRKKD